MGVKFCPKEGEYYYAPHRSMWGVWKAGNVGKGGSRLDMFITDFSTQIQAQNFVAKMNGWAKKPK